MDIWKSRSGKSQAREEQKREDQRRKRVGEKKMQVRRKGRKVEKHCVFPMICGSGGSKSSSLKRRVRRVRSHVVQMRDDKLHGVVARSTFGSHHVQSTRCSDHSWKLRCRKSARHCGAKHVCK